MSYILDALRKADAQRERDASRGIHAQATALGGSSGSNALGSRPGMWIAVALCLVAIGGAGWYFARTTATPAEGVAAAPQASTVPAAPVPAAPVPAAAPATGLAMQPPIVVAPAQANSTVAGTIVPPPPPLPAAPQVPMHTAPAFQPPQARAPAPVTAGLPADAPKVAITGGVYSPNPVQRMLIVNGQVFNEGSEVAPGLSIDRIEQRTAVLKFRGALYTVAY